MVAGTLTYLLGIDRASYQQALAEVKRFEADAGQVGRASASAFAPLLAALGDIEARAKSAGQASAQAFGAAGNAAAAAGVNAAGAGQQLSSVSQQIGLTLVKIADLNAQFRAGKISEQEFAQGLTAAAADLRQFSTATDATENDLRGVADGLRQVASGFRGLNLSPVNARLRELNELVRINRNLYQAGAIGTKAFREEHVRLEGVLEQILRTEQLTTRQRLLATNATARIGRDLAGLRGEASRLGLAYQVQIGLQNTLIGQLTRFGPVGAAAGQTLGIIATSSRAAAGGAGALSLALAPLTAIVAAIVALGAVSYGAARAAVTLEQAQAEVAKTTNLAADGLERLTRNLQATSVRTGSSTKELLDIAAVAGQLGVRGVRNLSLFTNTLNDLRIATDVVGEEGARQLARFLAATSTDMRELGDVAAYVGGALNSLENNLATTAGEILKGTEYTAQLTSQFRVSRTEVLAYTAAINSVGLSAEGAGTGIVRTFRDIDAAVRRGGSSLEGFARVAGMTSDAFAGLFRESNSGAVQAFIAGLSRIREAGGDVNATLEAVGITELRQTRTVATLAGGYQNLELALSLVNDETEINNSLQREVERRLNTVNGQWRILRSRIGVAAQVLGEAFLPMLRGAVDWLNNNSVAIGYTVAGLVTLVEVLRSAGQGFIGFGQMALAPLAGIAAAIGDLSVQLSTFTEGLTSAGRTLELFLREGPLSKNYQASRARTKELSDQLVAGVDLGQTLQAYQEASVALADAGEANLLAAGNRLTAAVANFQQVAEAATGRLEELSAAADEALSNEVYKEILDELGLEDFDEGKAAGKIRTIADVYDELNARLRAAPELAKALGEEFDQSQYEADALTSAITELITSFSVPTTDPGLIRLMEQLREVSAESADELARLRRERDQALTSKYLKLLDVDVLLGRRRLPDVINELRFQREKLSSQLAEAVAAGLDADALAIAERLDGVTGALERYEKQQADTLAALEKVRQARVQFEAHEADPGSASAAGIRARQQVREREEQEARAAERAAEREAEMERRREAIDRSRIARSEEYNAKLREEREARSANAAAARELELAQRRVTEALGAGRAPLEEDIALLEANGIALAGLGAAFERLGQRDAAMAKLEEQLTAARLEFERTGDAQAYASAQARALGAAIDALRVLGFDPTATSLGNLTEQYRILARVMPGGVSNLTDLALAQQRVTAALRDGKTPLAEDVALLEQYGVAVGHINTEAPTLEERIRALQRELLRLRNEGADPASEAVRVLARRINELNLLLALQELNAVGIEALSDWARAVLVANGLLAQSEAETERFGDQLQGLADSSSQSANRIVSGIGQVANAIDDLGSKGDVVAGLTDLFKGLREVVDGIRSGGPLDLVQGLATAGATAIFGAGAGGLVGGIFDFVRTLGEAIVDLFSGQSPASRAIADSIASAVTSGVQSALQRFRRGEIDRSELRRSIEASIGDAIFNATINALIQGALVEGALKPLLDEIGAAALAGDTERIEQLVNQIPAILDRVLPYILDAAERVGRVLDRNGLGPERQSPSTAPSTASNTYRPARGPTFQPPPDFVRGGSDVREGGRDIKSAAVILRDTFQPLARDGIQVRGDVRVRGSSGVSASKLRLVG